MICAATLGDALPTRVLNSLPDEQQAWATQVLRVEPNVAPSPHAFLIEQPPGGAVRQHFHPMAQFQVVVEGGGTLGRHPIAAVSVHYTGPHTGYGPIVAGPEGLKYFTLRPLRTSGRPVHYLPDDVARMQKNPLRRHALSEVTAATTGLVAKATIQPLLAPEEGGLAAWMMRLPAGGSAPPPRHPDGKGRFYLVTHGDLRFEMHELPALSVVWTSPDEDLATVTAGADGLDVVVLQFPAVGWDTSGFADYANPEPHQVPVIASA